MAGSSIKLRVAFVVLGFTLIFHIRVFPGITIKYREVVTQNTAILVSSKSQQGTPETPSPSPPMSMPTVIQPSKPTKNVTEVQEIDDATQKNATTIVSLQAFQDTTTMKSPLTDRQPPITAGICYDEAKSDRSGSVISNMLETHHFAFRNNLTYGGACPPDVYANDYNGRPGGALINFNARLPHHNNLINALGLKDELRFACPPSNEKKQDQHSAIPVKKCQFRKPITDPQWVKHIRERAHVQKIETRSTVRVAVHVRRGDIKPCGRWVHRLLPNIYYLEVLDHYLPEIVARKGLNMSDVRVTIYTEQPTYEKFDDFTARNYEVKIGGDPAEVWADFVDSDVLITSRSCFSAGVPSVFLKDGGIVIFPPGKKKILQDGWIIVPTNSTIFEKTKSRMKEIVTGVADQSVPANKNQTCKDLWTLGQPWLDNFTRRTVWTREFCALSDPNT